MSYKAEIKYINSTMLNNMENAPDALAFNLGITMDELASMIFELGYVFDWMMEK